METQDKSNEERERQFMIGLAKLTRETGMIIDGCGCCGSPSITRASDDELNDPEAGYARLAYHSDQVKWISHADAYDWEEYGESIVREDGRAK